MSLIDLKHPSTMEAVSFCLARSSGWIFGISHNTKRVTYITNTIFIVDGQGIPEVVYQMMFLWVSMTYQTYAS